MTSARPVHIILYCLGADTEDILLTTNITTEHRKKYQKVLEKFDKLFAVRRNVIFERARFNKSTDQQGESVEDYITVLRQLSGSCKCRNLKEEMIQDCFVVGIRDKSLSECLQIESELTLKKVKKLIRQSEAVQQQQGIFKSSNKALETVLNEAKGKIGRRQKRAVPLGQPKTK